MDALLNHQEPLNVCAQRYKTAIIHFTEQPIYLLDYGWDEPLGHAMQRNFHRMANMASSRDAVVIRGTVGSHFEDEVLSWHHVNGQPGEDILPAILITTRHPQTFRDSQAKSHGHLVDDNMILVPLNDICETETDVARLIDKVFSEIGDKKALRDFEVVRTMKAGQGGAIVDALVLQPNFFGLGINFNKIIGFFRK